MSLRTSKTRNLCLCLSLFRPSQGAAACWLCFYCDVGRIVNTAAERAAHGHPSRARVHHYRSYPLCYSLSLSLSLLQHPCTLVHSHRLGFTWLLSVAWRSRASQRQRNCRRAQCLPLAQGVFASAAQHSSNKILTKAQLLARRPAHRRGDKCPTPLHLDRERGRSLGKTPRFVLNVYVTSSWRRLF